MSLRSKRGPRDRSAPARGNHAPAGADTPRNASASRFRGNHACKNLEYRRSIYVHSGLSSTQAAHDGRRRDRARIHDASKLGAPSEHHHRAYRFAVMHDIETLIDVVERKRMGDEIVDVDLTFHVPGVDLRHLAAAARAAEGAAFPDPAGHELERPRRDFRPGRRPAADHRYAPAHVAAFQRLAHENYIFDTFE